MARPLRLERVGGRYHVTARGNEPKDIYRDDSDRFHFLGLLAELEERFAARVHAYVLMDNHFPLLLEPPQANLSRTMQWLGVSYSQWFNRRHQRVGHLFQGRFKALVIQDDAGWQEVAWSRIVSAVEQAKGESWVQFSPRRGDWGREGALWLGRRLGRLTLAQLGGFLGGVDYAAVGQAFSRFGKRLEQEPELRCRLRQIEAELSNVDPNALWPPRRSRASSIRRALLIG